MLSLQYHLCCDSGNLYKLLHIAIGGVCLLCVLVTIVISEKELVQFVTTRLWGRKIGKTNWQILCLDSYVGVVNLYKTRGKYLPIPQDIRDASRWLYQWGSSQFIHVNLSWEFQYSVLYMKYMYMNLNTSMGTCMRKNNKWLLNFKLLSFLSCFNTALNVLL